MLLEKDGCRRRAEMLGPMGGLLARQLSPETLFRLFGHLP